ncbi:unnamed protein product [Pocillopora meandrina]|uniref:Uncharacterized protein n=1 Tax=Pocillopora meandrina TaxID=46732 RepID=A0AAU9WH85_9CNID|nr:unnamed protein product [Pocillopora meandrina]
MQGYKIPFLQLPTPFVKRNNTSAREKSDFCFASCQRFTSLGPNCITCFSGKQRLVLNLRHKSWRSQGIPIAIFLDDGLGGGTDFVSAKVNSLVVHSDLLKSGFVPNEEKSLWEPLLVITWLGVILDTIDGTIQETDERIEKLNAGLVELLPCQPPWKVHVKGVAIVMGQITSLSPCVGSFARIMTRFLFLVVNSARSWESEVFLSDDSLSEISFWKNNLVFFNSKVCSSVQSLPVRVTFSDAPNSACGAFVKESNLVFYQNWSPVVRA